MCRKTARVVAGCGLCVLMLGSGSASASDPCAGSDSLLAVLDRPTVGDSACVVAPHHIVLEAGWDHGAAAGGGRLDTAPNAELRVGLPHDTEFVYLPPNWTQTQVGRQRIQGSAASVLGLKHRFGTVGAWMWTGEALVTTASGNGLFGSAGPGLAANGIVSYGRGAVGVAFMLGVSSSTMPAALGGQRYQSLNPDLVLTWQPTQRLQLYGEVYGANHTGYGAGSGVNWDGGLQYLVTPRLEVDIERGAQLSGALGGLAHYTGIGIGFAY